MAALCEFFRIGRIVRPHGVHGAVKLEPMSDSLMRYKRLREAYIERNGVREPITVSDVGVKEDAQRKRRRGERGCPQPLYGRKEPSWRPCGEV